LASAGAFIPRAVLSRTVVDGNSARKDGNETDEKIPHGENSKERMMMIKDYMNRSLEDIRGSSTPLPAIRVTAKGKGEQAVNEAQREYLNKSRNTGGCSVGTGVGASMIRQPSFEY
jgi:hypothetical protein